MIRTTMIHHETIAAITASEQAGRFDVIEIGKEFQVSEAGMLMDTCYSLEAATISALWMAQEFDKRWIDKACDKHGLTYPDA